MLILALALLTAPPAHAAPSRPRYLRLWNAAMTADLENENRIEELCPASLPPERSAACRAEKLEASSWEFPLRAKPDAASEPLGSLLVTATPGKGLEYAFRPAGGKAPVPFTPDVYDADWGYGPWADQSMVERRGDWVLLPPRPWPRAAWIDARSAGLEPTDPLREGALLSFGGRTILVKKVLENGILARDAIPSDSCGGEDEPVRPEPPASLIPWAKLSDRDGRVLILPANLRGC